jgi:hypothetical protein
LIDPLEKAGRKGTICTNMLDPSKEMELTKERNEDAAE